MKKATHYSLTMQMVLAMLFLFSLAIMAGGQTRRNSSATRPSGVTWVKVEPDRAGFSILMPSVPTTSQETNQIGAFSVITHVLKARWQSEGYVVTYHEYPPSAMDYMDNANPKTVFDFIRDRFIATVKGSKLLTESDTSIGGNPGREYVYESQGRGRALIRAYWVKPRLFQLMYVREQREPFESTLEHFLSANGQKFLASFQILDKAKPEASRLYDEEPLPLFSSNDMIWLGGELMRRGIKPEDAERFGEEVVAKAINYLSLSEQAEHKRIRMQALSSLSEEEKENYDRLFDKLASGQKLTRVEGAYSIQVMRKALLSLPKPTLARFQALNAKGAREALRNY